MMDGWDRVERGWEQIWNARNAPHGPRIRSVDRYENEHHFPRFFAFSRKTDRDQHLFGRSLNVNLFDILTPNERERGKIFVESSFGLPSPLFKVDMPAGDSPDPFPVLRPCNGELDRVVSCRCANLSQSLTAGACRSRLTSIPLPKLHSLFFHECAYYAPTCLTFTAFDHAGWNEK